ncbi:NAD(P)-dependent oxidoreductase [Gammaproteobacteria bacterium]|nr:NAD(P)-dependent oxidoreductase [Gammaproteobacteria bacterium]
MLVTGGSGFIGTNLVEELASSNFEIINLDLCGPRNQAHQKYWRRTDIRDRGQLTKQFDDFEPQYVLHLAANTEMNKHSYSSNIDGTINMVDAVIKSPSVEKVLFFSTMLVNKNGLAEASLTAYSGDTRYGKSKILAEQYILSQQSQLPNYFILRPTSIWGEWFGEPYRQFFEFILKGLYVHPKDQRVSRTFGYVQNLVAQVRYLLDCSYDLMDEKILYLGDFVPLDIYNWSCSIAEIAQVKRPIEIPSILFLTAAKFGDLSKKIGMGFPMTTFRYHNMTRDNVHEVISNLRLNSFSQEQGITRTLNWLRQQDQFR